MHSLDGHDASAVHDLDKVSPCNQRCRNDRGNVWTEQRVRWHKAALTIASLTDACARAAVGQRSFDVGVDERDGRASFPWRSVIIHSHYNAISLHHGPLCRLSLAKIPSRAMLPE